MNEYFLVPVGIQLNEFIKPEHTPATSHNSVVFKESPRAEHKTLTYSLKFQLHGISLP